MFLWGNIHHWILHFYSHDIIDPFTDTSSTSSSSTSVLDCRQCVTGTFSIGNLFERTPKDFFCIIIENLFRFVRIQAENGWRVSEECYLIGNWNNNRLWEWMF